MSWTDERIDRLKAMWTEGSTASQIAEDLGGVSRNAVIGKAHRLGLESRPSPVKAGEEKEKKAKPAAAPAPRAQAGRAQAARPRPRPRRRAAPEPRRRAPAEDAAGDDAMPVAPVHRPSGVAAKDGNTIQYRSVGPGGFIRQGPGDTQAPIPPAPPRRLVPAKPSRRGRRQDRPARPQRPHLPLADGPSGRARLPLLRPATPTPAIPIASIIAASPIRRSCRAATAARRRRCPSAARASARKRPRRNVGVL